MDREEAEAVARRRAVAAVHERIADLLPGNVREAGTLVGGVLLKILVDRHPASLSQADKDKIRGNDPEATEELIAERSLSDQGAGIALELLTVLSNIVLTYNPASHFTSLMARDGRFMPMVEPMVSELLEDLWDEAEASGMSSFGVACTTIGVATDIAIERGVPWALLARPLNDATMAALAIRQQTAAEAAENKEEAITLAMRRMGISRAAAKKYLAEMLRGMGRRR
jgi:hypothetical protein